MIIIKLVGLAGNVTLQLGDEIGQLRRGISSFPFGREVVLDDAAVEDLQWAGVANLQADVFDAGGIVLGVRALGEVVAIRELLRRVALVNTAQTR